MLHVHIWCMYTYIYVVCMLYKHTYIWYAYAMYVCVVMEGQNNINNKMAYICVDTIHTYID